jgi:hypothetical protein
MRSIPFLLLTFFATSSITRPPTAEPLIRATPVLLDPAHPAHTRVGTLGYLGGWELSSKRNDFGGISALYVRRSQVLAVADTGSVFRFTIARNGRIGNAHFGVLPAGPGTGAQKSDRDSESLAVDPATRTAWIGFERHNAIWRYTPDFRRATGHAEPREMADWPWNGGPEALARLADGRFIVICEDAKKGPGDLHEALLLASDPTRTGVRPTRFLYRAPPGFSVTDAAQLPDGRLLILHRDYSIGKGVRAALALIDPHAIEMGAVIGGEVIAQFAAPLTLDNMEALSIEREGASTILWIASDDNFSPLQRTLLMKFELAGE